MGQYNLGRIYAKDAKGLGDPEDLIRALMWFNVAAAALSGDNGRNAQWSRDSLASRMTPAQIEKAQKMARRCQETTFRVCDY